MKSDKVPPGGYGDGKVIHPPPEIVQRKVLRKVEKYILRNYPECHVKNINNATILYLLDKGFTLEKNGEGYLIKF